MSQTLDDEVFKKLGAHGVFRSGDAIQVIIGLHVSQLREQLFPRLIFIGETHPQNFSFTL